MQDARIKAGVHYWVLVQQETCVLVNQACMESFTFVVETPQKIIYVSERF